MTYRPCSGQTFNPGRDKRHWGICLTDYDRAPWWRAKDKRGRQRKFASHKAALAACRQMGDSLPSEILHQEALQRALAHLEEPPPDSPRWQDHRRDVAAMRCGLKLPFGMIVRAARGMTHLENLKAFWIKDDPSCPTH